MNTFGRSALSIASGLAVILSALVLDTWRAGQFQLRLVGGLGAALLLAGLLDLAICVWRGRPQARANGMIVRLGLAGALAAVALSFLGFLVLDRKGYHPNVSQFLNIRETQPFGPGQFARGLTAGAFEMTLTHGSGLAVERTIYPLDVTPSAEELHAAHDLLERTIAASSRFADFEKARKELGFNIVASALEGDEDPNIEHLVNAANMNDGRMLDPDFPESLVFQRLGPNQQKLVAYMYMTKRGQHGPQIGGPITRWHWHPNAPACMDSVGVLRARVENGRCPAGLDNGPTSEMMHVWLVEHSGGPFSHMMGAPGTIAKGAEPSHDHHD